MPLDHVCGFYDISLCRGKPYQQVIIPHPSSVGRCNGLWLAEQNKAKISPTSLLLGLYHFVIN